MAARKVEDPRATHELAGEPAPETPPSRPRARKAGRIFLMVAGGLAAPCLALAAFFFSSSGADDPPASQKKSTQQAGRTTATTTAGRTPTGAAPTTTTTMAAAPGGPVRDPFAALVTSAPAAGTGAK